MLTGNEVCIEGKGDSVLEIVAHEIRGYCPVYRVGDKIGRPGDRFREDGCFTHTCNVLTRVSLIQKGEQ